MGLVGPGFVGAHHIDAVRRLGFVDVVGVAAGSLESARRRADELGIPKAYRSYEDVVADPGKHIISDKPLATSADEARTLWHAARDAGVVHAVTFNYRGNPLVQQARQLIASGEVGPVHFVHGGYLQDWLLEATDFSWRLEPEKGGPTSAVGDIGSHWCDLAAHVTGRRIDAVLADLTTVVETRVRPTGSRQAFAQAAEKAGASFAVRSEDLATILFRFEGGAKGSCAVGQVCAGHKNDLWLEVSGAKGSLRWRQEQQNELWIGRRHSANSVLPKDPQLLGSEASRYAHLPGGHQEGCADAFCNVLRDVYEAIAHGGPVDGPKPPAFATFEDGYRSACVVDAVLKSHGLGGAWTAVTY
jgi:predicted dehydrogenase